MKVTLLLFAAFLTVIIYAEIDFSTGETGATRLNGEGCLCHNLEYNDSVNVWVEGPDSVIVSDSAIYKVYLTGGTAVAGGFNVASWIGGLQSMDTTTQINFGELTHSFPLLFSADTISWNFKYFSTDTVSTDTIYSVANSVNLDGNPQEGDEWNFGENFTVNIIDNPVSIEPIEQPDQFYLAQNYPNPFNPITNIQYSINRSSIVKLTVFDILGNEVTTLVSEYKQPGIYNAEFRITNLPTGQAGAEISSGVYLYRLIVGSFSQTKKMVLLR